MACGLSSSTNEDVSNSRHSRFITFGLLAKGSSACSCFGIDSGLNLRAIRSIGLYSESSLSVCEVEHQADDHVPFWNLDLLLPAYLTSQAHSIPLLREISEWETFQHDDCDLPTCRLVVRSSQGCKVSEVESVQVSDEASDTSSYRIPSPKKDNITQQNFVFKRCTELKRHEISKVNVLMRLQCRQVLCWWKPF